MKLHRVTLVLSSPVAGKTTFQAFLKSEFSDENIEFWMICEDFKKIKCNRRRSSRAKKIFDRYIQAEAPKEVKQNKNVLTFFMLSMLRIHLSDEAKNLCNIWKSKAVCQAIVFVLMPLR